ncbi:MAG: substrate-binding domain-containing protein [Clostridia bacterium]|nr:substrate-binding domain-containing protein [Clostridia bacterium]
MAGELMIVCERAGSNRKKPRENSIRQEVARTDLKRREVCVDDILKGKVKLSDPCIIQTTHRHVYAKLEKMFPDVRKIIFTETDDNFRRVSTVRQDTYAMACDVMEYLSGLGRKRLALFAFERLSIYVQTTLRAFLSAAEFLGMPLSMNDVFINDAQLDSCAQNFMQYMHRYDAVLCANDYAAAYLSVKLKENGVRVPEDMYIIGRGNSFLSSEVVPSITTIDFCEEDMGREAISLYWYLLRHPEILRMDVLVKHKLVVRDSTARQPFQKGNTEVYFPGEVVYDNRGYGELMKIESLLLGADDTTRKILSMLEHKSTAQIAEALFMSESTVKYRIGNIARIMGVKNRREALEILHKYNLSLLSGTDAK